MHLYLYYLEDIDFDGRNPAWTNWHGKQMSLHDPLKFSAELSAKLASRSRHICVFLGAGSSRACGLPDISQLKDRVLAALGPEDQQVLQVTMNGRTLEEALSRLRRIAGLVTAAETIDGLTGETAKLLDATLCKGIVKVLDLHTADITPAWRLAAWAKRSGYRLPLEFFTVNYDLILETAFERMAVPYFDGFIGSLAARFHTDLVEGETGSRAETVPSFFVRLWKLHGSVNWQWNNDRQIVRLGRPVADGEAAAIYPSDLKYEESRRVPFVVLQDRFRRALNQPETLVLISGYAFGDAHLNEMIFEAASRRERSEFVAFCFGDIPDSLAERALVTPNLQVVAAKEAVFGGVRAEWKAPNADADDDLWHDGKFGLRDFARLAKYLSRSSASDMSTDAQLQQLLDGAVKSETEGNGAPSG
jgi:hypothetical protein